MGKVNSYLVDLARVIGWKLVNDDKGFSIYEYEITISKYEKLAYIIRILEEPNELEIEEILNSLIKVLPSKLKRKLRKLMSKFKIEDVCDMIEVAIFSIEEYKNGTEYNKLKEYGNVLGVNIEELGYNFEYKIKRNKRAEIISNIELRLPFELAPTVGKLKKLDYKIAFIKNSKMKDIESE